ncbi:site-specific integrase [Microbacterium sp. SS28]|uniref:tyrosine-type recombinase/integrase n=1 Tax=Microbacterium sp. SS28 TaxID=2919948 RepID=UPI001FA997EB|nr:site-specific integrase [Microbacterium sp. SS28]
MARTKARKTREAWGQVDKLPSGRIRARYTGPDGERYGAPITFDTLTDARGWLAKQRSAIDAGTWSSHTAQGAAAAHVRRVDTLGEYAADWIKTRVSRNGDPLRPRTRVEYERLLAGPLAVFTPQRLASISPTAIRAWYAAERDSGRVTQAARAYGLLKAIMATAVTDGRIPTNPCHVRGAASATTGRKIEPPTPAELQKIVDAITPRYRAAVLIAAWAGCRYGELTELRRKDILIVREGGEVRSVGVDVARAVTHVTGVGFVVGKTKSEAGVRAIALPPHIYGPVLEHLKLYTADFPESLLFPAKDGVRHLGESSFVKHWYPARAEAGREDLPFHALRHYGATKYAQTGATLKEIQARLGHSTVSAAMKYQHAAGRDEELARRMSDLA